MADWELDVQLDNGAIPDLVSHRPVIFDTGQVIFGWMAAYRHSGERRYLDAARRGADWMLDQLDEEGVWRSAHDSGGPGRVYNVRAAWALLELARLSEDARLEDSMRGFLAWALDQERAEGWFDHNCLTNDAAPLLHTIAYTARGLLESGILLQDAALIEAARRTASRLAAAVDEKGYLPGRFDREWRGTDGWACLTGMAQISIVWRRLAGWAGTGSPEQLEQAQGFLEASSRVNSYLTRGQDLGSGHPGLRGGIRGSYPIGGGYGRWRVLNWATKFYIDALMAEAPEPNPHYPG
jgi:uncharacterized protein YyaL (SSP411 family)